MKKIALVVTVLLFLSIGAFLYSKVGDDSIVGPTGLTGLVVQDVEDQALKQEEVKKESPQIEAKVEQFSKTLTIPTKTGEEENIKIQENGVYLKTIGYKLYARHQKQYNDRWSYAGDLEQGFIKVFPNKLEETKI